MAGAGQRLFKPSIRATMWRENVPPDPTRFDKRREPNATIVEDLRVQFHIRKDLARNPNTCDVFMTNLAEKTRVDFERKPLFVEVQFAYDGLFRLMYTGDLRYAQTKLEGADWITLLQLGDGDCSHAWSRRSQTYPAGTPRRRILQDAARSFGMQLPAHLASDKSLDEGVCTGHVSHGPTRDDLTELLSPYGYTWSVQNNVLQVLRDDQLRAGEAFLIDEEHGMIGTPQYGSPPKSGDPPHMTVKMLCNPDLIPGAQAKLSSEVKSGTFRIEKVEHRGDTEGDCFTDVELRPLDAPIGNKRRRSRTQLR